LRLTAKALAFLEHQFGQRPGGEVACERSNIDRDEYAKLACALTSMLHVYKDMIDDHGSDAEKDYFIIAIPYFF
jgi:hypothetical protein